MQTLIFAALLISSSGKSETVHYRVDKVDREAMILSPANADKVKAPLVFCFHGHGGGMRQARLSFGMDSAWPEAVVVYMQGLPTSGMTDPEGKKNGWQQKEGDNDNRDLHFFDAVLKDVEKRYKIDPKRVYAMGHSNGGRFTQLLWSERGSIFAAVGPSGSFTGLMKLTPKPMFHILGESDPLVSPALQRRAIDKVKQINGCSREGTSIAKFCSLFKGTKGNDVETYVHPGGHEYPQGAVALMVEFFKAHRAD